MTRDEDDDLPELQPLWWLSTMTELMLRLWGIIRDESVTDEDRRDARGDVRNGDDE
jgi:hypothetical protein